MKDKCPHHQKLTVSPLYPEGTPSGGLKFIFVIRRTYQDHPFYCDCQDYEYMYTFKEVVRSFLKFNEEENDD